MSSYVEVAAQAVRDVETGSGVLVDVRRDNEWEYSHAKGALLFSITRLEKGQEPGIPKEKRVYTYCQAGGRAGRAVKMLHDMGYEHVVSIGGLNDWVHAGGGVIE